jgi:DNA-binding transcriptional MerR regulator
MINTNETKIKAYTPKELAGLYGVSIKTLRTWLLPHQKDVGDRRSKYYTARQVRIIFERLGEPG